MNTLSVRSRAPFGAALVLAMVGCSKSPAADSKPAEPSADAPVVQLLKVPVKLGDFSVTDLDGRRINSADLRGKVVLVNFWATWCPPCRAEIPDLVALQEKYRDHVVVLGISEDEAPVETVKAFAAQYKMNYPIVMTTPELSKIFRGVSALPTTFVLDREGQMVQRHVGQLNAARTILETETLAGLTTNVRIERIDDPVRARLENAAQAKEIPGIDLTALTPAQRTEAIKALNADDCTCGCGSTLAECRINDPSCTVSLPLAKALVERLTGAASAQ